MGQARAQCTRLDRHVLQDHGRARPSAAPLRPSRERPAASYGELGPQLTAFFTSAAIFAASASVSFVSPHEVGHMVPSSTFAFSSKPNVA